MATEVDAHDPHFEPIISLPEEYIPTLEEDEDVLFKMRAKLFRWASENDPPEWKERGTGDVKILKHKKTERIRLLMRRDKTYKTCANHYLDRRMDLVPNCGSDRAWVWTAFADFAEEEAREELLAIRFLNAENANKFKDKFDEYKTLNPDPPEGGSSSSEEDSADEKETPTSDDKNADVVADKLEELTVNESESKKEESDDKLTEESKETKEEKKVDPVEDSPEK